jgi:hypothetical protein
VPWGLGTLVRVLGLWLLAYIAMGQLLVPALLIGLDVERAALGARGQALLNLGVDMGQVRARGCVRAWVCVPRAQLLAWPWRRARSPAKRALCKNTLHTNTHTHTHTHTHACCHKHTHARTRTQVVLTLAMLRGCLGPYGPLRARGLFPLAWDGGRWLAAVAAGAARACLCVCGVGGWVGGDGGR